MRRLMLVVASGALIAMACGGGDKKATATDAPASSETSVATTGARARSTSTPKPSATKASSSLPQAAGTPVGGSASSKSFGTIFSSLFGGAFSGAGAPDGLGEGDPGLKQYLPDASDFPSGYETRGQHTFRTPDGISNSGGMDIAAEIATSGDPNSKDLSRLGIIAAMVIKPSDLQDLGKAFDSFKDLSKKDLEEALAQTGGSDSRADSPFGLTDVQVLDVNGLGDGAAGFQMTIDISALGALFSSLGGSDAPKLDAITMTIYVFARGDYAGAVMRMAFSDKLPSGVDDLALAKIIDGKLKSAKR